jgi:NADH-quinone oxidoreductase subunit L
VIAGVSLAGIFPFAGFWSKDEIVAFTFKEHYYVLFGMALLTVFLTAFYIFRAIFMAFFGEARTEAARTAVESPGVMTLPMILLAFLSVASGWVGIPNLAGIPNLFADFVAPSQFAANTLSESLGVEPHSFSVPIALVSVGTALAGVGLAYFMYVASPSTATSLARRFSGVHTFLDKGWYFDAVYGAVFVRGAKGLGEAVKTFDQRILGGAVGGIGRTATGLGGLLSRLQTGGVQNYMLFILAGVLVFAVIAGAQYAFIVAGIVVVATIATIFVGARL